MDFHWLSIRQVPTSKKVGVACHSTFPSIAHDGRTSYDSVVPYPLLILNQWLPPGRFPSTPSKKPTLPLPNFWKCVPFLLLMPFQKRCSVKEQLSWVLFWGQSQKMPGSSTMLFAS